VKKGRGKTMNPSVTVDAYTPGMKRLHWATAALIIRS